MKVKVTQVLHDLEGFPLRDAAVTSTDGKILRPERDFTLRKACTEALQALNLAGDATDGEERYKRFLLAMKIMSADEVDLTAEEITKLKRVIGLAFGAVVVGRCYEILDPAPSAPQS
jgi:hypothetical protein